MKHLIIIPGVGDDHPVYHKGAQVFRMFGYTPEVYVFGWNSADAGSYEARITALNAHIQKLQGDVYLLGVSAGGSVAVNCFARNPDRITKIATLCSPLASMGPRINPLLKESIKHTEAHLASMPQAVKQRLLSLHAIFDPVVATRLSKPAGVKIKTLPSILHPVTIFLGLTVFSSPIRHFFNQR